MGVNSNLKWLPLFSPDEAGESDGTSLGLSSHPSSSFLVPSLVHVVCEWGAIWRSSHTLGAGYQGYRFPRSFLSLTFASHKDNPRVVSYFSPIFAHFDLVADKME